MDIILFGHSLTFDIMKMDQKKRKRKENQAIETSFQIINLRTGIVSFLSFLTNNTTHCANQRYDSFLIPPTGTVKLLAGSPASCFARATRQTGKINNSLKFFKLII